MSSLSAASDVALTCSDFLSDLNRKPRAVEFVACQKTVKSGVAALEARYRLAGANAAAVEAYFVTTARMPRLRFICCGWETVPRNPKSQPLAGIYHHKGDRIEISMGSGEVTLNRRDQWREISSFYVVATRYLETP